MSWWAVILVTGGILAFVFLGFLALIGQANRLQRRRQQAGIGPAGPPDPTGRETPSPQPE